MIEGLYFAINTIFTIEGLLMLFLGAAVIGLIFGILPGLGASQAMIIFLPLTYAVEPMLAIIFYVAILATATFGGSIPAILINTPGTPANVVTGFDGHPFALRGEARKAIYISAICCFVGTTLGSIALLASIPVLRKIILAFATTETFWLIVFGLFMISLASKGNPVKGFIAGWIGVLISLIGRSFVFPGERFTSGVTYLYDGIPLAAFLIGLFAVSASIFISVRPQIATKATAELSQGGIFSPKQFKEAAAAMYKYRGTGIRSSLIGVLCGIVPAVGGAIASFISYFFARQFSKNPGKFGKGSAEGLIAVETASNAKDGGALMPTLAFGIPGDPNTAVIMGILIMFGVPLGFRLFDQHVHLLMLIIVTMFLAQGLASIVGMTAGGALSKLTTINTSYIVPMVLIFSFVGAYVFRGNVWDLVIVVLAALLAFGLQLLDYPSVGMIIGYFLGKDAERTFIMTLKMSGGDISKFFESSVSLALIAAILITGVGNIWLGVRQKKMANKFNNKTENIGEVKIKPDKFAVIFTFILMGFTALFLISSLAYKQDMRLFPLLVSILILLLLTFVLLTQFSVRAKKMMIATSGGMAALEEQFDKKGPSSHSKNMGKYAIYILETAVFATLIIIFGFFTSPFFVLYYILRRDPKSWRVAVVLAVIVAVIFISMGSLAALPMWRGAIPEVIPGFLGGGRLPNFF